MYNIASQKAALIKGIRADEFLYTLIYDIFYIVFDSV